MELQEFMTKSLRDIYKGIEGANAGLPRDERNKPMFHLPIGYGVTGVTTGIELDVAVTVSSSETSGTGAGVQIAVLRASIGGEDVLRQEEVSRIKFKVIRHHLP